MINLNSTKHKEGNEALRKAVEESSFEDWISYVNTSVHDGFLNITSTIYGEKALNAVGYNNLKEFFLDIDNFKEISTNPNHDMDKISMILYYSWEALSKNITQHLSNSRNVVNIPESGGLLIYVAGLQFCLITRFHRNKTILEVIDAIEEPQSVFDFWGSINHASMMSRNMLKEILSTGHKLIYHRGILIHVDKRKDIQVFGPSIDTILLNEVLCQHYFEEGESKLKATEIGCGNGLLSISTAKNLQGLKQLDIIDVNINAIYCTNKNLNSNLTKHVIQNKSISFICGKFSTNVLKCQYDLAICNPPYIPLPKSNRTSDIGQDYFTAVGGLEVIDEIFENLDVILNEKGELLLLISHLTYSYVMEKLPNEFIIEEFLDKGHEVLFDVEAVFSKPRWFNYLKENYGIITRGDTHYHEILPLIIKKK